MEQGLSLTGNRIELKEISRTFEQDEKEQIYYCIFVEWYKKDEIKIRVPSEIEMGKFYFICLYTKTGLFRCKGIVKDYKKQKEDMYAFLQILSGFEKYQRRHYYRMLCALDLSYYMISDKQEMTPEEIFSGVAVDISGGGLRFNASRKIEPGTQVRIQLQAILPILLEKVWLQAKVLACVPLAYRKGIFEHRAEFISMTNQEREAMIQYIFLEERKRKKKGERELY